MKPNKAQASDASGVCRRLMGFWLTTILLRGMTAVN
jgi:hypothetical protein